MKISEIFYSIQGEGPFMGIPAVFVRFSGCPGPLCSFCDTKYSQGTSKSKDLSALEVFEQIKSLNCKLQNVIITGGEPFYQWGVEQKRLLQILNKKKILIYYETSGKILIPGGIRATIISSPKFLQGRWAFLPANIRKIDFFKFVVFSETALERIISFIKDFDIPPGKVFLMPGGKTRKSLGRRNPLVWKMALELGYSFTTRLHIMLQSKTLQIK